MTAEGSRNHHNSYCLLLWRAAQQKGWMEAALQRCSRTSPRWRHCGSWRGRRNTGEIPRQHGESCSCDAPLQRAGRSCKKRNGINTTFFVPFGNLAVCCLWLEIRRSFCFGSIYSIFLKGISNWQNCVRVCVCLCVSSQLRTAWRSGQMQRASPITVVLWCKNLLTITCN